MNKKIIAVMIAATLLFVGVFAACNKTNDDEEEPKKVYLEGDEYPFLTDENGNRLLDENGEFIVYQTNEDGSYKRDEKGDRLTVPQAFEAYSEGNKIEDYGYAINLPKGWKATDTFAYFENAKTGESMQIDVIKSSTYQENYETAQFLYENSHKMEEYKCYFEDNITSLGEEFEGLFRLSVEKDGEIQITYTFKNSGNLYCITYTGNKADTSIDDSMKLLKCINFKPFQYYPETTTNPSTTVVPNTKSTETVSE